MSNIDILQASAYAHIKAAEEFGKLGNLKRRDEALAEYNEITKKIQEIKNDKSRDKKGI